MATDQDAQDDKEKKHGVLDLGISLVLLEPSEGAPVNQDSSEVVTVAAETENPSTPDAPFSEYERLSQEGKWHEIISKTERALGGGTQETESRGEDRDARLWWIEAQLRVGGVPLSILSAPLEDLSRVLIEEKERLERLSSSEPSLKEALVCLTPQIKHTAKLLREIAKELLPQGSARDPQGATSFYERAYKLDATGAVDLLGAITAEHALLNETKDFSSELERAARLDELRKLKEEIRNKVKKEEVPPQKEFNVKALDEKTDDEILKSSSFNPRALKASPARLKLFTALLLLLVVGGLLWCGVYVVVNMLWGDSIPPLPELIASRRHSELKLPELQRVERLSHLDALYYEMESQRERNEQSKIEDAQKLPSRAVISDPVRPRENRNEGSTFDTRSSSTDTINTTSPVERKPPPPEEEETGSGGSPDWGMSRKSPVLNGLTMRPTPMASSAAGEQFIERYPGGKEFRVLVKTRVMNTPSYRANSVTTLLPGDIVLVEERVGDWLKLRSKRGSPGFILVQDSEPR